MKITIETNGNYEDTIISFNDEKLIPPKAEVKEFHLSIHPKGKVKLQLVKYNQEERRYEFISMYGGDFEKFDEFNNLKGRAENYDRNNNNRGVSTKK
ncbi:MAG: hypothetical protein QXJ14_03510 [Candidatus Aenigmatarchaeota archaeon]